MNIVTRGLGRRLLKGGTVVVVGYGKWTDGSPPAPAGALPRTRSLIVRVGRLM